MYKHKVTYLVGIPHSKTSTHIYTLKTNCDYEHLEQYMDWIYFIKQLEAVKRNNCEYSVAVETLRTAEKLATVKCTTVIPN